MGGCRGLSEGKVVCHAGGIQDVVPDGRVEACQVKAGRVHKSAPACTHIRQVMGLDPSPARLASSNRIASSSGSLNLDLQSFG